jgi:hypothetical protein
MHNLAPLTGYKADGKQPPILAIGSGQSVNHSPFFPRAMTLPSGMTPKEARSTATNWLNLGFDGVRCDGVNEGRGSTLLKRCQFLPVYEGAPHLYNHPNNNRDFRTRLRPGLQFTFLLVINRA